MPTTDHTPTDPAPDAGPDGLAPPEAAPTSTASATTAGSNRASTPGADGCPLCGTATINCHGRLDCPSCAWTEVRSIT